MASKPTRNDDALRYWADSVLGNTPCDWITVNSMILAGDTIYHYGPHYPMAKIGRKTKKFCPGDPIDTCKAGPAEIIYVNSTLWGGASGYGQSTDAVVRGLRTLLQEHADTLGIPVLDVPLCSRRGTVELHPDDASGPKPVIPEVYKIPVCPRVAPLDPGPEPVKDPAGCIAGTTFEDVYTSNDLLFGQSTELVVQDQAYTLRGYSSPMPGDFFTPRDREGYVGVRRMGVERVYFGEASYSYGQTIPKGHEYKQCPHCKAFDVVRYAWSTLYNGGYGVKMGYLPWTKQVERFGSVDAWRNARKAILRESKEQRAALSKWTAKNVVNIEHVPTKKHGNVSVPDLDPETGKLMLKTLKRQQRKIRKANRERMQRIASMHGNPTL